MKLFFALTIAVFAFSASNAQVVSNGPSTLKVAADESQTMIFLGTISDLKWSKYSVANDADAKVVQFLVGETVNPFDSYLVITAGGSSAVFPILKSVQDVTRITFSAIGELTVNYQETEFDQHGHNEIVVKKSIKIKFSKTEDGTVSPTVEILK